MCELRGDGGGFEKPASAARQVLHVVVVVRLKMLLAHEEFAEDVTGGLQVHVQGKEPLSQLLRVAEWKPMKDDVRPFYG